MKRPNLLKWKDDYFPPIDNDTFLNIDNVLEVLTYTVNIESQNKQMYEALKEVKEILNLTFISLTPEQAELRMKVKTLLKSIEDEV